MLIGVITCRMVVNLVVRSAIAVITRDVIEEIDPVGRVSSMARRKTLHGLKDRQVETVKKMANSSSRRAEKFVGCLDHEI